MGAVDCPYIYYNANIILLNTYIRGELVAIIICEDFLDVGDATAVACICMYYYTVSYQ